MEGDPFPKRLFATDIYAFTHQTFSLARMLLLNNQPTTPPPTHLSVVVPLSQRQIEDETLVLTRKILGTATSHADSAIPFISTLAVSYAGHLLTDRLAQEHAYGILHKAQRQVAGLTPAEEFTRLRQIWAWDVPYANVL
ncbi:hypothetical protein AC579_208 [Pseudocercospora musae]|uniref:Uncharacterized protein n=1 Tax=Pseudocercospora musae TaxID=113226 RepID=A0A139GTU5_9PEZI|nr:hypothetical protein AC579_208 [Pseudocercospora musae]